MSGYAVIILVTVLIAGVIVAVIEDYRIYNRQKKLRKDSLEREIKKHMKGE